MSVIQLINVDGNLETQTGPIGGSSNFQSYSTNFFSGCIEPVDSNELVNVSGNLPNALGTGPFTISFWINLDDTTSTSLGEDIFGIGDNETNILGLNVGTWYGGPFSLNLSYGSNVIPTAGGIETSSWNHILITRDSNNRLTIFLNGSMSQGNQANGVTTDFSSNILNLFRYKQGNGMRGKITGFSVSQNVWITSNFTPNAHPLNNDPSMQVILNASSEEDYLKDSSSNNIVLTQTNTKYGTDYPKVLTQSR